MPQFFLSWFRGPYSARWLQRFRQISAWRWRIVSRGLVTAHRSRFDARTTVLSNTNDGLSDTSNDSLPSAPALERPTLRSLTNPTDPAVAADWASAAPPPSPAVTTSADYHTSSHAAGSAPSCRVNSAHYLDWVGSTMSQHAYLEWVDALPVDAASAKARQALMRTQDELAKQKSLPRDVFQYWTNAETKQFD